MVEFERGQRLHGINTTARPDDGLRCRIADPLWFLSMQWLTGEFEAENGGRVATIRVEAEEYSLTSVTLDEVEMPVDTSAPLERLVEAEVDDEDPAAWSTRRLEYGFGASTSAHDLLASEYHGDHLDWYHFDVSEIREAAPDHTVSKELVANSVSVSGAPEPRWWQFEEASGSVLSYVDPEPNALSMLLPEFLMIDVNNWFMIPLSQRAGSVRRIKEVEVIDSFGHATKLGPAIRSWKTGDWGCFVLDGESTATREADGSLLFVPNVAVEILQNVDVEEVRFLRDEDARVVWAHERRYQDEDGRTVVNGDDLRSDSEQEPGADEESPRFVLANPIASSWTPYVPRQLYPSSTSTEISDIYLRRARTQEDGDSPQYHAKVVEESWRIDEHEVPRSGVRVRRIQRFARGSDGAEHFWIGRVKEAAQRLQHPAVRFDYLDEKRP